MVKASTSKRSGLVLPVSRTRANLRAAGASRLKPDASIAATAINQYLLEEVIRSASDAIAEKGNNCKTIDVNALRKGVEGHAELKAIFSGCFSAVPHHRKKSRKTKEEGGKETVVAEVV